MNPIATITELETTVETILQTLKELKTAIKAKQEADKAGGDLKRPDGRLSLAGIQAIYGEFENGKLSDEEIAEKYEISVSGTKARKRMWREGR